MTTRHSTLDAVRSALPGALVALDFDGTLAPIVDDPTTSAPVPGVIDTLVRLAEAGNRIAVVTGRDALTVLRLGGLERIPGLVISGLHGAETWRGGDLSTRDEPAGIAALRELIPPRLPDRVWLEDKRLSLVVHTRLAADPDQALIDVDAWLPALVAEHGLEVSPGKMVAEIRLPGFSKATALAELLTADTTAALYAGDDLGDLPAVEAVATWGARHDRPTLTVTVGDTAAMSEVTDVTVAQPSALADLLARLVTG